MVMQLSVTRTVTRLTAPGWRMNHLLWRTTVLLSLSLNSVLSGKDYEGEICQLGERLWGRKPKTLNARKWKASWFDARWLGKDEGSEEHLVFGCSKSNGKTTTVLELQEISQEVPAEKMLRVLYEVNEKKRGKCIAAQI